MLLFLRYIEFTFGVKKQSLRQSVFGTTSEIKDTERAKTSIYTIQKVILFIAVCVTEGWSESVWPGGGFAGAAEESEAGAVGETAEVAAAQPHCSPSRALDHWSRGGRGWHGGGDFWGTGKTANVSKETENQELFLGNVSKWQVVCSCFLFRYRQWQ